MNFNTAMCLCVVMVASHAAAAENVLPEAKHLVVAREAGRFLAWPANHGPGWSWGREVLVAFCSAEHAQRGEGNHAYDPTRPLHVWLARSLNGGQTWRIEKPASLQNHKNAAAPAPGEPNGGIRSNNRDCILLCDYEDEDHGRTWFQISEDRGRTWGPRQWLPTFDLGGVSGRTDYLMSGMDDCLLMLSVQSRQKPKEGRVVAARTRNGGKSWAMEGQIGPDPKVGFSIQPSTVRLSPADLVCATRFDEVAGGGKAGIQIHASHDDGRTWRTLGLVADTGRRSGAPALLRLDDGRLALTYAQRDIGRICATLSTDGGVTWSPEITLRSGAGNWDFGYPRNVALPGGEVLTIYYWNDSADCERYIAATRWKPPAPRGVEAEHTVVFHRPRTFAAWPANGGLWAWDNGQEALVGFCTGSFKEQSGHNILEPYTNRLARTRDGGSTWTTEEAAGYAQQGAQFTTLSEPLNFAHPDLALRNTSTGYHGAADSKGGFLYSYDRGRTWKGPFRFGGLLGCEPLRDWEITCRTDYVVNDAAEALFVLSARAPGKGNTDRVFCAITKDGGRHFDFGGWVVGKEDPHRAVMPATVRVSSSKLVTTIRRRELNVERCWVDAYASDDNGLTWRFLGKVGNTGKGNGNPPALLRLRDGRLCCAYGDRDRKQMLTRLSADDGVTWSDESILRSGYRADKFGDADFGYPRLFQRADGRLVCVYYWSSEAGPEASIQTTIWSPEKQAEK